MTRVLIHKPAPPARHTPEVDAGKELTASRRTGGVFTGPLVQLALAESLRKLDPRGVARNPVMFVVEVGAVITSIALVQQLLTRTGNLGFTFQITLWLWFTVVFANFAEAMAEARGKAQADTQRATKRETPARRIEDGREEMVASSALRKDDLVLVRAGETIPSDGEAVDGVAYVNEAAITG
ncbi:MAG: potassium-transporting ATPase subunit B, partial [Chloroflexi bacterium]|nr:potassium-transporting ATPase subunit B [Chloroflexota bacterium]